MKSAAMYMAVMITLLDLTSIPSDKCPEVGLLDHTVVSFLI
jgi:hypothetical protein